MIVAKSALMAMAAEGLSEVGFEVREEVMIPATGDGNPTTRLANFLKPTIDNDNNDESVFDLPPHCLSFIQPTFEPKNWPLNVKFYGWRFPQSDWKRWVDKMASLHEHTWKKAGIYEAILTSAYKIRRNDDLVLGLAEKWCPETKSFVFNWGEATITLEDMMILGFSVLGSPVFTPLETEELKKTEKKLNRLRMEFSKTPAGKAEHFPWLKKFIDTGSEIEHEAFLALWLSRFVFPFYSNIIVPSVFPIAIHLARGTRIALAPAILAAIYRDLSSLKENIVNLHKNSGELAITIRSPFELVLIWAWERFVELRPNPNLIKKGEPRIAQWHDIPKEVHNVRTVLDSAKESFDWRPYSKSVKNWNSPKFYVEKEMWVSVGTYLCEELQSYARCLRTSELVGLDCIEQYLPHRVAMQFGMDQDLPACVARANQSPQIAWADYNKPIGYADLYIPPRLFQAGVTTRYSTWWKQSLLHLQATRKDALPVNRNFTKLSKRSKGDKKETAKRAKIMRGGAAVDPSVPSKSVGKSPETSKGKKDIYISVVLGSPPKKARKSGEILQEQRRVIDASASAGGVPSKIVQKDITGFSVPPGFALKKSTEEDNLSTGELLKSSKHDDVGKRQVGDGENFYGKSFSFSITNDETVQSIENEHVRTDSKTTMESVNESKAWSPDHDMMKIQDGEGDGAEDRIEALLCKLERTAEELKACTTRLAQKWLVCPLTS